MKYYKVYVESTVSMGFGVYSFNHNGKASRFCKEINNGDNTLRAKLI